MKMRVSMDNMCENCGDKYWCSGMCKEMYESLPNKRERKRKRKKNAHRNYACEEYGEDVEAYEMY